MEKCLVIYLWSFIHCTKIKAKKISTCYSLYTLEGYFYASLIKTCSKLLCTLGISMNNFSSFHAHQTFDFCEKKDVIPPFLKKMQLFFILNIHVIQPILLVGPANEQTKASHLLLWVDFQIAPPSKQIMSLKRRLEQDFRPGNADKWIVEFL